ncbi:MAG: class I SAM-dependent methyltransferase [Dehalococcoidales bacterium]
MTHEPVKNYYAGFGEREWDRLKRPDDGFVEYAVTRKMLSKYLKPKSRILDIGGGPGRYAMWLAKHGHRVVLADLSPELLAIARTKLAEAGVMDNIKEIIEADACDLSHWQDNSFDAVLSLGPFYHLIEAGDREKALAELRRVLKPQGVAFVALMPRYGFIRRSLAIPDERRHLTQPEFVARVLEQGVFINDIPGRFTDGYGVRPEKVPAFFAQRGFTKQTLLAAEGIVGDLQRILSELEQSDPATYQATLDIILKTADDPGILGTASHVLYIGKKDDSPSLVRRD